VVSTKEIDDVGRKSFDDLNLYMRAKLQVQFSNEHAVQMRDAYFLRHVIAHSAGYLRKEQLALVPQGVEVKDAELRIGQEYLNGLVECLESAVEQLNDQLRRKFGTHRAESSPLTEPGAPALLPKR
jgi:hypothetical protein